MMKSAELTPNSSVKSSPTGTSTTTSMESENRESCYFPGCRKDANCNCEICIASINATLDLMPQSIHRSSLTKLSGSKPNLPRSPISFNPSSLSPPKSRTQPAMVSQPLNIAERMISESSDEKIKRKKKKFGTAIYMVRLLLALSFLLVAEYGFSWVLSGVLQPKLSPEMVRNLGEKSLLLKDLNERLFFLKNEVWGMVHKDLPNCRFWDSSWKIDQDGLLLNSQNVLYGSMTEEVSIWGWPLQTAGLLTAEFSSRSFTILSGRVTEWTNEEVGYLIRKTNSSWIQEKWSASHVQLDPNTWILEYRQRSIMENSRLLSAALQLLKFRLVREVKKIQQEFWQLPAFGSQYSDYTGWSFKNPT